ncbi:transposable element Tc1 transposase [Trichonephila clavipes]|nr:transposable element Tc1 transposase [Trichonephila clavipes]
MQHLEGSMQITRNIQTALAERSAFDQVSEFDRGRIVAYRERERDCRLSFREIGSRVGRNQTTVMRICDRWMQEVSARTIRRRLQQSGLSARRSLLGLLLTQNHRRLRCQWCDERRMWVAEWNEVVFTDKSRICLQHHDGRIRVWRHRGERMLTAALCTTPLVLHRVLWYGVVLDITLALI